MPLLNILQKIEVGNFKGVQQIKKPEIIPQKFQNNEPCSDKGQHKINEIEIVFTFLSTFLHNAKMSTPKLSVDNNHITSNFMSQLSDPIP